MNTLVWSPGFKRSFKRSIRRMPDLQERIEHAMKLLANDALHPSYEIIDDAKPYYGEVPERQGVWSTGKTLEECRKELQSVIEG